MSSVVPSYGLIGLILMIVSEAATLAKIEPFWSWNTPICWTGFILFADASVYRARGKSWLRSAPGEFVGLTLVSIPLWLVFEVYNLYIRNWYYTGLPENTALRLFGYAWSFATIWPAIFEAAALVAVWRRTLRLTGPDDTSTIDARGQTPRAAVKAALTPSMWLSIAIGAAMLAWPLLRPSAYLAAPVWLGFILLLDPVNARRGAPSLIVDISERQYDRLMNLSLSGLICGILWELWNFWARAKWHYTVPIMENLKIFEMPVPGYLGFPPFALECFTMYAFVRSWTGQARCNFPLGTI